MIVELPIIEKNKTFKIELNAQQVHLLYEMCEFCCSAAHASVASDVIPAEFGQIMSIQNKLDGCVNVESNEPTLLELAVEGKDLVFPAFKWATEVMYANRPAPKATEILSEHY